MPQQLRDVVKFRADRLFQGAVNVDWFDSDPKRSKAASDAFVFHGPQYHGVRQEDVGKEHGHDLVDTASLTRTVARQAYGLDAQGFTLSIAGYGTGKSHLALTLANLLSEPRSRTAEAVLGSLKAADETIAAEVKAILAEARHQPCLVIALNGMRSFDLTTEVTRQVVRQVKGHGLDTKALEELRPRFGQAQSLVRLSSPDVVKELLIRCGGETVDEVLIALGEQDERVYAEVHDFFANRGMPIRALGGESVREVIDAAVREYCGRGKAFRSIVVLFDEFGRYTEFATVRSHIAGSGALQDLFEVIQAHEGHACFVGFIQFELSAYVHRIAPEYKNEILRYVTRYQSAKRVYLSINLETLIASLIDKSQDEVDRRFGGRESLFESQQTMKRLHTWFPQTLNHRLWKDPGDFHKVVRRGCWPLSPFSTWLLFYLASAGKHLQERSAIALLADALARNENVACPPDGGWALAPVDLWSDAFQQELVSSEESGQQGSVTHAYATVDSRHGARLTWDESRILQAIVLASKLGLQASGREDASTALAELAGIASSRAAAALGVLRDEYNVIDWDESFKEFNILGDAVPRTQFLAYLRQQVASGFDEAAKARLFAAKAAHWCDLLGDVDCDFAEQQGITTREWRFRSVTSNTEQLAIQVKLAADQWRVSFGVDEPRGFIIYCYVDRAQDLNAFVSETNKLLRAAAKQEGFGALPVIVVPLFDEDGSLGQALAETAVLEEGVGHDDRVRFGNLIPAQQAKLQQLIRDSVSAKLKERRYLTGLASPVQATRLGPACSELFSRVYKHPIPFPFDGFTTAKGNAADTCQELTNELLTGRLDYDSVIAKPVKAKNRAVTVLKDSWGIFATHGKVSRRPAQQLVRSITEQWDEMLASGSKSLPVDEALKELCLPPYGANIASAGLVLGVFVAPRAEKLVVVRGREQLAISSWLQSGIYRGKFLDLDAVKGIHIVSVGEASSEWETLLDEWEQAESYLARKSGLERARALVGRVPIPPALAYREQRLRDVSEDAVRALAGMAGQQDDAIERMEKGLLREDPSTASWGAADLKRLIDQMASQRGLWTEEQVRENQPRYERARQEIIQLMPRWLPGQIPNGNNPAVVGNFQHKMLNQVGGNLKKIGLDAQFKALETYTQSVIRKVEAIASAHQLARDVDSWITGHRDVLRTRRVAELRMLRQTGDEHTSRLQQMAERVSLAELGTVRTKVSAFLSELRAAETEMMTRAERLWHSTLRSEEDIEKVLAEVEAVVSLFEGLPVDQEDLVIMRKALRIYLRDYQQLSDAALTCDEFARLAEQLRLEASAALSDDEPPWSPDETVTAIVESISQRRTSASESWTSSLEHDAAGIEGMPLAEVSRLHTRATKPPSVLAKAHEERVAQLVTRCEIRLDALKVEWLLEKFRELPAILRKKFLKLVSEEL